MIPNPDTYCEIDPTVVDQWGIPVLAIPLQVVANTNCGRRKDMQETFRSIVEAGRRRVSDKNGDRWPVSLRNSLPAGKSSTK